MPKIIPCSRNELVRKLKVLGFVGPISGGKHSFIVRENYRQTIPNPHGKDLSSEFVKEILKQANITKDDWLRA